MWLTRHLLLNDATPEGFLRWLFSVTDAAASFPAPVTVPHWGEWQFQAESGAFICTDGQTRISADYLYRRRSTVVGRGPEESSKAPRSYQFDEQALLLLPYDEPGAEHKRFKLNRARFVRP